MDEKDLAAFDRRRKRERPETATPSPGPRERKHLETRNADVAKLAKQIALSTPIDSQPRALAVAASLVPIHRLYLESLKLRSKTAPGLARELAVGYARLASYYDGGAQ